MANQDLLKEAIAEAKAIREAAISNAKDVMEESLTPHLKDMLAAKLQEMEHEEMEEGSYDKDEMEEAMHDDDMDEAMHDDDMEEAKDHDEMEEAKHHDEMEEAKDHDEMEEAKHHDEMEEAKDHDEMEEAMHGDDHEMEEAKDDEPAEDDAEESEDEAEDDDDIKDMEVGDLKALIRDIIAQELEGHDGEDHGEEEHGDEEGGMEDMVAADDEEIDLNELLAELEKLSEDSVDEAPVNEEEVAEEVEEQVEEEVNEEVVEETNELQEALDTIEILRSELQEVNLLNSKLLYVNKIFKATNLSETQKVNIIATFDEAETVKEVKLVYKTVSENIISVKSEKTNLKEHKSFASKAAGNSTKGEVIPEVNEQVKRMQVLAGIIK